MQIGKPHTPLRLYAGVEVWPEPVEGDNFQTGGGKCIFYK